MNEQANNYSETQYNYTFVFLYVIFIALTGMAIFVAMLNRENSGLAIMLLATLLLLSFFMYMVGKMKVEVTEKELLISMGLNFNTNEFLLHQIDAKSLQIEKLPWWFGFGNKQGSGNRTLFRIGFRPCISFKLKHNNEKYYVSSSKTEALLSSLQKKLN